MDIRITKLPNGLTVATDHIEHVETASVGIFVNIGSVNETKQQSGISHFIEHMAFKGTSKRSALDISKAIESVGGHMNAYTSNEITAYYAKVLKDDVPLAIDILTDILQDSQFERTEFEKEQSVIIQEIHRINDSPESLVFELFQAKCFDGGSLGMPIIGTEENILSFTPDDLANYLKTKYSTHKMILCASGNVQHDEVVELAEKYSSKMTSFEVEEPPEQKITGGDIVMEKGLEQTHIVMGFKGVSHTNPAKYALEVLATVLGGGMSSRLFQEIREKRGLVYAIYAESSNFKDTGVLCVYAGCADEKAAEVIDVVNAEFARVRNDLTKEEVERAKTQIKASLLMGLESPGVRMRMMGTQYLTTGKILTAQEIASIVGGVVARGAH